MPVQFLLGRAGSGKSHRLRERITRLLRDDPLGSPVYLLVPKQATFEHERHFAVAEDLPGYARLRVVSFDSLGDEITSECGGAALPDVTAAGRELLLGHLLRTRADALGFFRSAARHTGTIREIERTLSELDRAGVEPIDLLDELSTGENAAPEAATLVAKVRDLALIGDAYRKLLGDRLDPARRLARVFEHIDTCRAFEGAHLFVDAFDGMGAFDRELLVGVAAKCAETTIALTLDPNSDVVRNPQLLPAEDDLFADVAELYRRLHADFAGRKLKVRAPVLLEGQPRFEAPALKLIERDWSQPRPGRGVGIEADAVRMIEVADGRAEADAAARQVKDWTLAGHRLRDCAVLCRDMNDYRPVLEASFAEHGLPYFLDRRRPAHHHPVVRFLRSLLRVAAQGWPHDAVMQLCKSRLAGLDADEADLLENYVLDHRIRGRRAWTAQEPWAREHAELPEADTEEGPDALHEPAAVADQLRRKLAEAIEPLTGTLQGLDRPMREFATALWQAVEAFDVPRRVAELVEQAEAAGETEAAAEHRQAWAAVCDILDQAVDLLGGEVAPGRDFVGAIDYALDNVDFAVAPPTADAVILGDADRTVLLNGKCCIVIGLNDGVFPKTAESEVVLGDEDRRILRDRSVEIDPAGPRRQQRERHLGYKTLTSASEHLTLVRSTADAAGRPTSASPFWDRVRRLLALEPEVVARDPLVDPSALGSERQAVVAALKWARDGADPSQPAAAIYAHLCAKPEGLVQRAWPSLSYANDPQLADETRDRLYAGALDTSVSRLETFAACPFKHFAAHTLKLRVRDEQDVTPRDLGVVYHDVLERLIRDVIGKELDLHDADELERRLPKLAQEVGEQLRGGILTQDGRSRYLLGRIGRTLKTVIAGQRAALGEGAFTPAHTELTFGGEAGRLPPLELKVDGRRVVRIYGRIDRVDTTADGVAAAVIDYKTTSKEMALKIGDVYHRLSLQLLVYLLVLQEHGGKLSDPPPQPVAAFYVKLLRGLDKCDKPDEAPAPEEPIFDLRVPPRGVIEYDHLPLFDGGFLNDDPEAERHRGHVSAAFKAKTTKGGDPYKTGTDILESEQLDDLLLFVRRQVKTLAKAILEGDLSVRPYRIGRKTPCSTCAFGGVCRFEPAEGYDLRELPENLWDTIATEADKERREVGDE